VPNNEANQPDFEQLDDLFDESQPEAEGSANDPLGSLGSLDSDPLSNDAGLDPLGESDFGFPEDAGEQDEGQPDKKSKKKKKKAKKKKKTRKTTG